MLDKAVKGLVVMSAELEAMFNAFNLQEVPGLWVKMAYPCLKPLNASAPAERCISFFRAF